MLRSAFFLGLLLATPAWSQSQDLVDCLKSARQLHFNSYGAGKLCAGNGNVQTTVCARRALQLLFSHDGAMRLCTNGGTYETAENCANSLMTNGSFNHDGAAGVCTGGGNSMRAHCALAAIRQLRFSTYGAMLLCSRGGTVATYLCAGNALDQGYNHDGAIYLCGLGGTLSRTECSKDLTEAGYSLTEAFKVCHPKWREAYKDPRWWEE